MEYRLRRTIDELMQACDTIHDELCIGCPIEEVCLRDASVEELWNFVSENTLTEFIELADKYNNPEEEITEEDRYISANEDKWKEEYYERKYGK